jgi:hypothetical protein
MKLYEITLYNQFAIFVEDFSVSGQGKYKLKCINDK